MRIAVASDNGRDVSPHLGGAWSFIILDLDTSASRRPGPKPLRQVEVRSNPIRVHHGDDCCWEREGPDCHCPLLETLADCSVVISRSMGWRIARDLVRAGMRPVVCRENNALRAARKFVSGRLSERLATCGCERPPGEAPFT